jgi:sec-independent protein translocase protein TatA
MKTILFLGSIGGTELIIILIIVLLLFGGRKIPQLARDIGLGIKEFRKSLSGTEDTPQITYQEEESIQKKSKKAKKPTSNKRKV